MPRKLLQPCVEPGCPRLSSARRCPPHARRESRRYEMARGSAAQRGYDEAWRRLRAAKLRVNPWCQADGCSSAASEVDHKISRAAGGTEAWANLQSLCKSCHSRKTAVEARATGGHQKSLE